MATLPTMQPLSPTVSYLDPGRLPVDGDPDLILIFSWLDARDRQIAKYLTHHRALFPASPIMLFRIPPWHMLSTWLTKRDLAPVVPMLRALINGPRCRRILVHTFSNGGLSTAVHLRQMVLAHGIKGALPTPVVLLDSCPGYFHWHRSHHTLKIVFPWWFAPLFNLAIALNFLYYALRRLPATADRHAQTLNLCNCRRTYLYGTADDIIDYRDVEDNARKAADAGFAVRMERFDGGMHVALALAHPERYWAAVRRSWKEAS
ncbi:hypothetical protein L249_0314 [Ophiocordyceps polyrhachis-furcata BCC 54312]|uniref:Transmembrane protein 53 n=1 Tax=Ophiocordyceps polyrhachis-furcata BCC 54312 TaxID=1330021 RepID=A0A367LDW4_9HYPO|nr:hypothetical protein L249_0314 [Ophiocordyceps polyrhachis-furcata BCC 54312]